MADFDEDYEDELATTVLDFEDVDREPEISPEIAEPFGNAALIGDEKLRSTGFFVNIVRRSSTPRPQGVPRVLVVEDDPGTSAVIEAVLSKAGFKAQTAADLPAIKRVLSVLPPPHLILLDILLPDANGFAILERLRRHPDLSRVPVLMLTSLSGPADVAKGLALGATGYMSKPARPQALLQAIHTVLGLEEERDAAPAGRGTRVST